jgi:hypothetical protein
MLLNISSSTLITALCFMFILTKKPSKFYIYFFTKYNYTLHCTHYMFMYTDRASWPVFQSTCPHAIGKYQTCCYLIIFSTDNLLQVLSLQFRCLASDHVIVCPCYSLHPQVHIQVLLRKSRVSSPF